MRNPWLLSLIPIAVAAGGAVGGYYMGRASIEASVATLVLGIALIIPAAILVAHGRSYRAGRSREDEGFVDRTDEGRPYEEEETSVEISADEGPSTETEVIGPQDGEEGDGESGPSAQIDPNLPVGGMIRLVAQASHGDRSLQLGFNVF